MQNTKQAKQSLTQNLGSPRYLVIYSNTHNKVHNAKMLVLIYMYSEALQLVYNHWITFPKEGGL